MKGRGFARATGVLAVLLLGGAAFFALRHVRGTAAAEREWQAYDAPRVDDLGAVGSLAVLPLVNWHTAPGRGLRGEVGVSYLVRTDRHTILFDLGHNARNEAPSPLEHNMRRLGVGLDEVDAIFLSHAHFDHVGGKRWSGEATFATGLRQPELGDMRVFTPIPMKYPGLAPLHTPTPRVLLPGVATTGTIARRLMIGRIDEQALVVHLQGRGLVVIVGCGHQTLEKILARVEAAFEQKLYALIGDLHYPVPTGRLNILGLNGQRLFASGTSLLDPLEWSDVEADIERLRARGPGLVALGGHDSSDEAIARFAGVFGEAYRHVRVGEWIEVR